MDINKDFPVFYSENTAQDEMKNSNSFPIFYPLNPSLQDEMKRLFYNSTMSHTESSSTYAKGKNNENYYMCAFIIIIVIIVIAVIVVTHFLISLTHFILTHN